MFILSTNITKTDMKKKSQNRRNSEIRTQNFLRRPTMVGGKFLGNSQFRQTPNFFEVYFTPWCRRQLTFGFVMSVTLEYQPEYNVLAGYLAWWFISHVTWSPQKIHEGKTRDRVGPENFQIESVNSGQDKKVGLTI